MTFHQAGPADAGSEVRANMHDGWSQTLDKLAELIVYHAMWLFDDGQLCPSCSLLIDGLPHLSHLHARNTTFPVVARGPLEKLREYSSPFLRAARQVRCGVR